MSAASLSSGEGAPYIAIMAIQGAVSEHVEMVKALGGRVKEVRQPEDFVGEAFDGIILPGGESTAMAIVGEECGIFPVLREWVQVHKKPIWGTCAGMILLSDHAIKQADTHGQSLLGGLDVYVCRNYFGSQIHSTVLDLQDDISSKSSSSGGSGSSSSSSSNTDTYPAVFIRAPAILQTGPKVETLASIRAKPHVSAREQVLVQLGHDPNGPPLAAAGGEGAANVDSSSSSSIRCRKDDLEEAFEVKVAVKQGNILATAFHPELTKDLRWHKYFFDMIGEWKRSQEA